MTIRTRITSSGIVAAAIVASTLLTAAPANAADISIPDAGLRGCVNAALGQQPDDPISDTQAATVTDLSCFNLGISTLTGLESFTNLSVLELGSNQISDLAPLIGLTSLQTLGLGSNQISDISTLGTSTGLRQLYLGGNQIQDVTPLANLSQLTSLDLASNQIQSIAALSSLSNVQILFLHFNEISDVSPLAGLVQIKNLLLVGNHIVDVSPLSALATQQAETSGTYIDAINQEIVLPDVIAGDVQDNPTLGYLSNTDRVPALAQTGTAVVAADGLSWTYTAAGPNSLTWSWVNPGTSSLTFSGVFLQQSTDRTLLPTTLVDDAASTTAGSPVTIDVLVNDGLAGEPGVDASTLTLVDDASQPVSSLTVTGGTFELSADTVIFTPESGFAGAVPSVTYQVTNTDGVVGTASIVITVTPASSPSPSPSPTAPVLSDKDASLASTGADATYPALVGLVALMIGAAVVSLASIHGRKRAAAARRS